MRRFDVAMIEIEGEAAMKNRIIHRLGAAILTVSLLTLPTVGHAQQAPAEDNGVFVLGSILYSIIHLPLKLVTCVGTQATAAVAYTATYGVPGNYDGGDQWQRNR
jgi:hypothetical protein